MMAIERITKNSPLKLRCLQTNEVAPLWEWARKIALKRGSKPKSVAARLYAESRYNMAERLVYGLNFECLTKEQDV